MAASLAEAIRAKCDGKVEVETIRGSGGVYDVEIDGEMVFRKWEEFRFPENKEILELIEARLQKV